MTRTGRHATTTDRRSSTWTRLTPWDPAATHRFVTSDGTALHVDDSGPEGGADLTVIMLHGWTLDHTEWQPVVHSLTNAVNLRLRVIRYDHRGHGGSAPAKPGTATIAQLAEDLAELIADRVKDGPIVLVGHSMGGATIMAFAERHPELLSRVAGTVFVATTSGGLSNLTFGLPHWLAPRVVKAEQRVNRRLSKIEHGSLLRRTAVIRPGLRWLVFGKKPDRRDVADTAAQLGRGNPASIAGFRTSLGEHERREALAALRDKPTVVLAGGADRLLPIPHARIIADELRAELVIYPDAGHMLNVERTVQVADRIAHVIALAGVPSREG
jgi:pimeloyl-ACP methyl ester carboxylesterase